MEKKDFDGSVEAGRHENKSEAMVAQNQSGYNKRKFGYIVYHHSQYGTQDSDSKRSDPYYSERQENKYTNRPGTSTQELK